MNLIKTDKQAVPEELVPCKDCPGNAEWIGVGTIDTEEEVWQDRYKCPNCHSRFFAGALLWCDPETGDFYAYETEAEHYAPAPGQMELFNDASK